MAYKQYQWQDHLLNVVFLIMYAIPVFVVAPFLIEYIGLRYHFPFRTYLSLYQDLRVRMPFIIISIQSRGSSMLQSTFFCH